MSKPSDKLNTRSATFRPRLDRIADALMEFLGYEPHELINDPNSRRERLRQAPAAPFTEIFKPPPSLPRHFGKFSQSAWTYVNKVFKPADLHEDSPPDTFGKSVQIADVYERFLEVDPYTKTYLEIRMGQDPPAMVPFPRLSELLTKGSKKASLADTQIALEDLTWRVCERLNLLLPISRSLLISERAEQPGD